MNENDRVKDVRKQAGLTQDEFGAKLGIQKSAVSKIERGENAVSDQVRLMICQSFDIREEWLRTGEGEKFAPKRTTDELERFFSKVTFETPGFRRVFLTMLSRLSDKEWDIIEQKAAELAEGMKKSPTSDGRA